MNTARTTQRKKRSRSQTKKLIEGYFYQLTQGCGRSCGNMDCVSGGHMEGPLGPNDAAAKALHLLQDDAKLCDLSHHKNSDKEKDQSTFSSYNFWKEPIADVELNLEEFEADMKAPATIYNPANPMKRSYADVLTKPAPPPTRGSIAPPPKVCTHSYETALCQHPMKTPESQENDTQTLKELPQVEELKIENSSQLNSPLKENLTMATESFTDTSFWKQPIQELDNSGLGHLLEESKIEEVQQADVKPLNDSSKENVTEIKTNPEPKKKLKPFNYGALFPFPKAKVKSKTLSNPKDEKSASKASIESPGRETKKEEDEKNTNTSKQYTSMAMKSIPIPSTLEQTHQTENSENIEANKDDNLEEKVNVGVQEANPQKEKEIIKDNFKEETVCITDLNVKKEQTDSSIKNIESEPIKENQAAVEIMEKETMVNHTKSEPSIANKNLSQTSSETVSCIQPETKIKNEEFEKIVTNKNKTEHEEYDPCRTSSGEDEQELCTKIENNIENMEQNQNNITSLDLEIKGEVSEQPKLENMPESFSNEKEENTNISNSEYDQFFNFLDSIEACKTDSPIEDVTTEYEEYMKNQDSILEKGIQESASNVENDISDIRMENMVSSICKETEISDPIMKNMASDDSIDNVKENMKKEEVICEPNKTNETISWPEPSLEEKTPEPQSIKDKDYNQFFDFLDSINSVEPILPKPSESNTSQSKTEQNNTNDIITNDESEPKVIEADKSVKVTKGFQPDEPITSEMIHKVITAAETYLPLQTNEQKEESQKPKQKETNTISSIKKADTFIATKITSNVKNSTTSLPKESTQIPKRNKESVTILKKTKHCSEKKGDSGSKELGTNSQAKRSKLGPRERKKRQAQAAHAKNKSRPQDRVK